MHRRDPDRRATRRLPHLIAVRLASSLSLVGERVRSTPLVEGEGQIQGVGDSGHLGAAFLRDEEHVACLR
jgi:hypothetical protein